MEHEREEPRPGPVRPRQGGFRLVAAVIALGLGLGATAAVFSVVDSTLLTSPPYREPERLVLLQGSFRAHGEVKPWPSSQMDSTDWRQRNTTFAGMSVFGKL